MVRNLSDYVWWREHSSVIRRDLTVALIAGTLTLLLSTLFALYLTQRQEEFSRELVSQQERFNEMREVQAVRLENLRFVREISLSRDSISTGRLPFSGLDLAETGLAGLDLSCKPNIDNYSEAIARGLRGCADLGGADLRGVRAHAMKLRGANLTAIEAAGANFIASDLSEANFANADLRGASLRGTDLRGAGLSRALIDETTNLERICYDESTSWPDDLRVAPSADDRCAYHDR